MIYSYDQLKNKIKVGDEVRAVKDKTNPCGELNNDGSNFQKITGVSDDGFDINGCYHFFDDKHYYLEIIEQPKTFDNLEVGDILINKYGDQTVVLGICGRVHFLSVKNNPEECDANIMYTATELKNIGYTIKQSTPVETIELMGQNYNKSDIENALKDVKPLS